MRFKYIFVFIMSICLFIHITFHTYLLTGFAVTFFNVFSANPSCSCETCVTERRLDEENWFFVRYKHNVQLMLNRNNSVLDKDLYKWWKGLQNAPSKSSYEAVVEKLFSLIPDGEHYSDAGPDRCRTCAVVGNSGNLLGSHYGPLIDFHDFVIRINKGPTKGYEKDVGSRTTHRFMYPESAVDVDNNTHLVFSPFKILDMEWLISAFTTRHITHTYSKVRSSIKANKNKVKILHPAFIKYVHDNWSQKHGQYPSTGFITLILALHICDEVSVFGFGAKSDGHWHHYFDRTLTPFNTSNHGGEFENKTIHHLHLIKKIMLFNGRK